MTDPIADMLTRIRNASAIKKPDVVLPMSKMKFEVAKILKNEGWVNSVEVIKGSGKKNEAKAFDELKIVLNYRKSGNSIITSIKRISKPGLRVYADKTTLPKVLNNLGIAIISTSSGLMTNKEARKKGLGGEVVCEIY
ncbi:MAG: 30S ribosomal protein S8 [Candidatus Magasanikbacteria bacterium]|nr:30S ribosomal protein S8 [Candidatus Magasanikbacteria bacterium]